MRTNLTRKQKAFADHLIANPKLPASAAALEVYGKPDKPTTIGTARMIASENLTKPNILAYLHSKAELAEGTMVEIMTLSHNQAKAGGKEGAAYASVAVSASKDILDRVHGRATQKIETTSTVLQIGIDLSLMGTDQVIEGESTE